MSWILKNNFLKVAAFLLFFSIASQLCMAREEVPPLPMTVKGVALVDGTPAPNGTIVSVYLNGVQVGKFPVNTSSGEYCFWVSGTATDEGKPVKFLVNGKDTGKILAWKSGRQVLSFQLSVGKGANSEDFIKSLTSNINSESLTKIENPKASGKDSEAKVIEGSVPEPDVNVLKSMSVSSLGKEAAKAAEDSTKLKSAPGFTVSYAFAGMVVLIFGFNLMRKRD